MYPQEAEEVYSNGDIRNFSLASTDNRQNPFLHNESSFLFQTEEYLSQEKKLIFNLEKNATNLITNETSKEITSLNNNNNSNNSSTFYYNLTEPIDYCNEDHVLILRRLFATTKEEQIRITEFYRYAGPILTVICIISIIFNIIIISISRRGSGVNKSQVLLLSLNLAFTDILGTMLSAVNFLHGYLKLVHNIELLTSCQFAIVELFRGTALISSALHLLALAFIHYRGTVDPIKSR